VAVQDLKLGMKSMGHIVFNSLNDVNNIYRAYASV